MESLKKLSDLFNSELQETKLKIMEKRESTLEKFQIEKLGLQKQLKQIEESLEFFEKENEDLNKVLAMKEKDYLGAQTLFDYEKKSIKEGQKQRVNLFFDGIHKAGNLKGETKKQFEEISKKNLEKTKEIEKLLLTITSKLNLYKDYLGLKIEKNQPSIFLFEISFKNLNISFDLEILDNKTFNIKSWSPSNLDYSNELYELNQHKRLDIFLIKIIEKFAK